MNRAPQQVGPLELPPEFDFAASFIVHLLTRLVHGVSPIHYEPLWRLERQGVDLALEGRHLACGVARVDFSRGKTA